jgi:hypothetical protein
VKHHKIIGPRVDQNFVEKGSMILRLSILRRMREIHDLGAAGSVLEALHRNAPMTAASATIRRSHTSNSTGRPSFQLVIASSDKAAVLRAGRPVGTESDVATRRNQLCIMSGRWWCVLDSVAGRRKPSRARKPDAARICRRRWCESATADSCVHTQAAQGSRSWVKADGSGGTSVLGDPPLSAVSESAVQAPMRGLVTVRLITKAQGLESAQS